MKQGVHFGVLSDLLHPGGIADSMIFPNWLRDCHLSLCESGARTYILGAKGHDRAVLVWGQVA